MKRFVDKVVIVTGASKGIGKATAERFVQEGAKVAICARNEGELRATEQELRDLGGEVMAFVADVSDADKVEEVVAAVVSAWGRIDVLCNNAGIGWEEEFLEITADNWRKMIDVNLNGMFYFAQRVSKQMVEQGSGGSIINMSSTNGITGEPKYAHYNASKGGIVLLTKTMAVELGKYNIRVNAVNPGYIQTPMSEAIDDAEFVANYIKNHIPIGRVGKPKDVAGVYAFLASDDAAFVTGETILIDGGQLAF